MLLTNFTFESKWIILCIVCQAQLPANDICAQCQYDIMIFKYWAVCAITNICYFTLCCLCLCSTLCLLIAFYFVWPDDNTGSWYTTGPYEDNAHGNLRGAVIRPLITPLVQFFVKDTSQKGFDYYIQENDSGSDSLWAYCQLCLLLI